MRSKPWQAKKRVRLKRYGVGIREPVADVSAVHVQG